MTTPEDADLRTIERLDDLAELVSGPDRGEGLYLRWSRGPTADLAGSDDQSSRDGLTGVPLPGLSANPLRVEEWWGDRSRRLWVARRLHDYRHLRHQRGPGVRPWVLRAEERGRGPDNEPLVVCREPVAWVAESVLADCDRVVAEQQADDWGPLDRSGEEGRAGRAG
ncbi:DUF6098 family protein [Streptoalloteichus tenebrarius]|uniref:DUF6098 family protein n=1 Tax=Streptoalloteichus tenebrarius (strain ATCC 17920 / DSM 40477 / JCM 4838 / CBS 697.72 / NBRC 16177 / NCIMB 11028 / NRRL B-12390 / A12253. 1 / ISP 5477) TaxID=1933 RepID=UPI0020A36D82|nr:DUF6098 family protein [Streptoalloteichus tenebrarius]